MPRGVRPGSNNSEFGGFGPGRDPGMEAIDDLLADVADGDSQTDTVKPLTPEEEIAVLADGGDLARDLGYGPQVTEPRHRLTDLPEGVIDAVLNDGVPFDQAMAEAAQVQPPQEEQQ